MRPIFISDLGLKHDYLLKIGFEIKVGKLKKPKNYKGILSVIKMHEIE